MKHQTPTGSGTLAHIRIKGVLHRRHFPHGTDPIRIKEWLFRTESKYRRPGTTRTGKFDDDARVYLEAVKAMPSYADRERHIEEWIAAFGARRRDEISSDEIRAQLHRWRTESRTVTYTRRPTTRDPRTRTLVLSASAVNKRRTALMHLYAVLDGKSAPNPVRDAPKFAEPKPLPRAIPYPLITAMFARMRPSKSKARLMVIAYTGTPHAQLKTLQATDVDLVNATVRIAGRRKGQGTRERLVPLIPEAVRALKLMAKEDAWGPFSNAMLRLALRRAMATVHPALAETISPYDLRHSFGTEVYRRSGDIRATQLLLDTTQVRYMLAAEAGRVQAAVTSWSVRAKVPAKRSKTKNRPKKAR